MDYTKFRLRSFTTLHPHHILKCGSYFELPLKYCAQNPTDEDTIYYYYDICAIPWNRYTPKNTKCTVLRIDSKQTPPGFARLVVDRNNMEDNPTFFRRPPVLRDIKTGGPSFLHEHRLTDKGHELLKKNKIAVAQGNHHAIANDNVFAVYCPYWPVEAEEWRKRKRFHGWPNEKLVARITRGGCHFVSKLRTWSSCDDTEWRFSFSKAELLLIHSWTPGQKFAYHVIRVAKRRISESCGGDGSKSFQTYYFKTLMLWACEEFSPDFWLEQNIDTCVKTVLLRFHRCLYEKFCPSYFIPGCNIMSHLENEVSFEKELQSLQMFLINVNIIFLNEIPFYSGKWMSTNPFEHECITSMLYIFSLSRDLNGRVAHFLSECEWCLAEMRNLHAAIDANLRLMSVNSATERQTNKDYVVCVENFNSALLKREEFEPYEWLNTDVSLSENFVRMFARKLLGKSFPVYCRMSHSDEVNYKAVKESNLSTLHIVTSAYRANFYFTATQSYKEAVTECEKCFDVLHNKAEVGFFYHNPSEISSLNFVPVLVSNSLSRIFDEQLQIILGFATLHRNISFFVPPITVTSYEVCLKLDAAEFLRYIFIQCQQKLYPLSELTDCCLSDNSDFYQPSMSQLMANVHYSDAILVAALRQSRPYRHKRIQIPSRVLSFMTRLAKGNINALKQSKKSTINMSHYALA